MARSPAVLLACYRLLLALALPLLTCHVVWLAIKHRNGRFLRERLGFFSRGGAVDIWFHAASVGEVNAVTPLVRLLQARHPAKTFLVTTATITGAATAQAKLPFINRCFLPIDRVGGVRRFLSRLQPSLALVVETELWPTLFAECRSRALPIVIVNGRISLRTMRAPQWLRDLYGASLSGVGAVLARTDEDCQRFVRLGARAERVRVLGNLKFAAAPRHEEVHPFDLGRPYLLAASTREGEEKLIVDAWQQAENAASHLLVIVPRHPHRTTTLLRDLDPYRVAVRSRGDVVNATTEIYIADTFGELPSFMAGATLVVMGGSLVSKGGQNLLEPAALGRPTITGPHMSNFAAETTALLRQGGVVQVQDPAELTRQLSILLADEAALRRLGENARRVMDSQTDVADRYADAVDQLGHFTSDPGADKSAGQ